jgi:hypothetical protein
MMFMVPMPTTTNVDGGDATEQQGGSVTPAAHEKMLVLFWTVKSLVCPLRDGV